MPRPVSIFAATALLLVSGVASAQSSSFFGGTGVTSRSGTSGSGLNSSRATTGQYGNSAAQTGGAGVTGFTGQQAGSTQGFSSGAMGSNGFVGRTNTGFTGNRNAANSGIQQNGQGGLSGGGQGGAFGGQFGNQLGRGQSFARSNSNFGRNSRNQGNQNFGGINQGMNGLGTAARVVQPQQRIAFEYVERPAAQVRESVTTRLSTQTGARFPGISAELSEEGELTLRGTVKSEEDSKLAAAMARLEPGVRTVTNELTVESP